MDWLRPLASLKLTLVLLLALLAAVINAYYSADQLFRASLYGWLLTLPLAALTLNLVAAIVANPAFRAQPALLVFHLALLALVLLAGLGQLTNLKAWTEVSSGGVFEGQLEGVQAGPLHPGRIDQVRFRNQGFDIHYAPGPVRRHTSNRVSWRDESGALQQQVVGDQIPLIIDGYRFYTSFNKGFAPQFLWRSPAGQVQVGTVHLPAWPLHQYNQAVSWQLPGSGRQVWVQLEFDDPILSATEPSQFRVPNDPTLILRWDEQRRALLPGESLSWPEGELVFQGVTTWMGYTVYYDQSRYWMLAAGVMAVLSLGWHFSRKFGRSNWMREDGPG